MKSVTDSSIKTEVLAHRGDSVKFPENTMPAFKSAVDMQVDRIETDVHLTSDGKIVIWHDNTMERMTGDKRQISELSWKEMKEIDAGTLFTINNGKSFPFKGKKITPILLETLLKEFPDMRFNIDLKDNNLILAEKYGTLLKELKCTTRVVTASFNSRVLKHFRKLFPDALTSCTSLEVLKLLLLYRTGLLIIPFSYKGKILQVPEYSGKIKILSKGFIKYLHKRGFKVQVWTINQESEMKRFIQMGVDGIFTDKPELLIGINGT